MARKICYVIDKLMLLGYNIWNVAGATSGGRCVVGGW
jgi:hypothetical protein